MTPTDRPTDRPNNRAFSSRRTHSEGGTGVRMYGTKSSLGHLIMREFKKHVDDPKSFFF